MTSSLPYGVRLVVGYGVLVGALVFTSVFVGWFAPTVPLVGAVVLVVAALLVFASVGMVARDGVAWAVGVLTYACIGLAMVAAGSLLLGLGHAAIAAYLVSHAGTLAD